MSGSRGVPYTQADEDAIQAEIAERRSPVCMSGSPVVSVFLCPDCAGYEPLSKPGYEGALSGTCRCCGKRVRELHRFPVVVESRTGCSCSMSHPRVATS